MSVYIRDTKVLLGPDGKVATSTACCCGGTPGACCIQTDLGGPLGALCDCLGCHQTTQKSSSCVIKSESECAALHGIYKGDGTLCTPNPCPIITWTEGQLCNTSWPPIPGRACVIASCCTYVDGIFGSCVGTTESQCQVGCCSPPCPRDTLIWHGEAPCSGFLGPCELSPPP